MAMIWDVPVVRNASCTLLGMPAASCRIVAQQDAREERRLRFGEDVRDDVLGMSLERTLRKRGEPPEWNKTLIAREHYHVRARHERVHALASQILAMGKSPESAGVWSLPSARIRSP